MPESVIFLNRFGDLCRLGRCLSLEPSYTEGREADETGRILCDPDHRSRTDW